MTPAQSEPKIAYRIAPKSSGENAAARDLAAKRSQIIFFPKYPATAPRRNSDTSSRQHQLNMGRGAAMRWHTSSASSSADIVADLFRLIHPNERVAFREMLERELRGRELPDGELRRVAERAWHRFLKHGWPT
jgi:hypothetical protein